MATLNPKLRSTVLNLARVAVSVGLLGFIFYLIDPRKLAEVVRAADFRLYALALSVALVGVGVRAYRWLILLRAVGARVSFGRALYLYFIGAFFNSFLPTGFGGDVMRVLEVGEGASSQQAAGTALVDRLTGFIMLFGLALVALPFAAHLLPSAMVWLIALLAGGIALGSGLLFEGRVLRGLIGRLANLNLLTRHARLNRIYRAGMGWVEQTYGIITACGARAIAGALLWSLIFNLLQTLANFLLGLALGINVSPWLYFVFVPVATVTLLIPATVSGLGAREGTYILLFAQVGVGSALATTFSLGSYSLDLAGGIIGGIVYLGSGLMGLRK